MQKLKCLIVDDEELAIEVIERYIAKLPMLEVSGKCKNSVEAIGFLYENPVDIMFLDINIPVKTNQIRSFYKVCQQSRRTNQD